MTQITLNTEKSRFETTQNGLISFASFEKQGAVLTITHVVVAPELRGGGVASSLAAHVVEYARREGFKIEPQCPFMAAWMQKHPESGDVRA